MDKVRCKLRYATTFQRKIRHNHLATLCDHVAGTRVRLLLGQDAFRPIPGPKSTALGDAPRRLRLGTVPGPPPSGVLALPSSAAVEQPDAGRGAFLAPLESKANADRGRALPPLLAHVLLPGRGKPKELVDQLAPSEQPKMRDAMASEWATWVESGGAKFRSQAQLDSI